MLGPVLTALNTVAYLIATAVLWDRYSYSAHSTDEETEVHRG